MRDLSEFEQTFKTDLDRCADAGVTVDFWWRDDDAVSVTEPLERLIETAERFNVPVLLAIIPEPAQPALFDRLKSGSGLFVSQHGFAHTNHEEPPAKAAELGDARPQSAVLAELELGYSKLEHEAGKRFLPILTPPWNRIAPAIADRRAEIGLTGLSTFGPTMARHQVNTHLDVIAWKAGRRFIGAEKAGRIVDEELSRRSSGDTEPFGLLTHHLVHDQPVWDFIDCFLSIAAVHPAARWPAPADLFDLPA